jgi:thiamine pyrophosphokinase
MDFFQKFRQLYNYSKSVENIIFINDEAWIEFQNKSKHFSIETFETLYKVILHYHYIETKKTDDFPYKLKNYNGIEGGIIFEPKNLPLCLQYMLLNW